MENNILSLALPKRVGKVLRDSTRPALFFSQFDSPGQDPKSVGSGRRGKTYVSVLVEHANDAVGEVEDVPPVEVGHVGLAVLRRAAVQEVEDVPGGEGRLLQGPVDEIHDGRVADSVLIAIERNAGFFYPVDRVWKAEERRGKK